MVDSGLTFFRRIRCYLLLLGVKWFKGCVICFYVRKTSKPKWWQPIKKNVTQYFSWVSNGLLLRSVFNWVLQVIHEYFYCAWLCSVCDWSRKLVPPSQPIRLKTKTNRDLVVHVFLHLITVAFTHWLTMMSILAPIDFFHYTDW